MPRLRALVPLLLAGFLAAQRTWVVDQAGGAGSDFRDIPAAVNAATDGDVVLCRAGNYTGTTTSKGLTLLGEQGATLNAVVRRGMTVVGLPAGKTFVMKGFSADFSGVPGSLPLQATSIAGRIHLEDLDFVAGVSALDVTGGTLTMTNVRASGNTGANLRAADLTATRCAFAGRAHGNGVAVMAQSGRAELSHCNATCEGTGAALFAWVSSLTVAGDSSSLYASSAGPGMHVFYASPNYLVDPAVRVSGTPQFAGINQPTFRRLPALEAAGAAPGQSITTSLYSPAGELVVLVLSWPDYPFPVPPFGTMWIDPTGMFYFAVGYQDQTEHWQQQLPVPAFAPRGLAVGLQGMSGPGLDIKFGNAVVVLLH